MLQKSMPDYIKILSINLGCTIRLARLKKSLSQHDVGIKSGTDSISVGRIERAEYNTAWHKIILVSDVLGIKYKELFVLKSREELISIVNECYSLETKLNQKKKQYYASLQQQIEELFSQG